VNTSERLNLLLIGVDQWRGDALGCAGHPVVQTPHLDVLASEGVRFRNAYAACPSCIPARAELMTGLCGARNGFVGYRDGVPWEYATTLAGTLAAAGYHTQCVGKMHVYPWRNLLGYHHVVLHDGYMHRARRDHRELGMVDDYLPWLREQTGEVYADHNETGIGCNGYAVAPWCHADRLHPSAWVTTQSIDFLRRRDPTKPFFLTMSYHRPHPPLDPPASYLDRYRDAALPPIPVGDWVDYAPQPHHGLDSPLPADPAQMDLARRAYFAQITFIDHQLNRMFMALNDHGLMDHTAILFFADHGSCCSTTGCAPRGMPTKARSISRCCCACPRACRHPEAGWSTHRWRSATSSRPSANWPARPPPTGWTVAVCCRSGAETARAAPGSTASTSAVWRRTTGSATAGGSTSG